MPRANPSKLTVATDTTLVQTIHFIRGQQVMLDDELSRLYGVETRALNQAVKRNVERFPKDFMFQLDRTEFDDLKSQTVTSSSRNYGGRRKLPFAFTEQGVAMLSSVLNSDRAVQVNIAIMRAFVNIRKLASTNEEVAKRLSVIESKLVQNDEQFKKIFGAIRAMLVQPQASDKQIGYIQKKKKES